jgi:hypothetical protein
MRKPLTIVAATAVLALPVGAYAHSTGTSSHGKAGQHGNHCGLHKKKKVKGVKGGLKVGKTCVKKGATGPTGPTGATGPTGPTGLKGKSASRGGRG